MRAAIFVLCLSCGCALTSKADRVDIRYFSPETVEHPVATKPQAGDPVALRLGRVTSSANLRSRIVHRDSAVEVGDYETLRWTEDPEVYVRRALARTLFEDGRRLQQAVGGAVPTLDVEVVAFEEVRRPGRRSGRVQIQYLLQDERSVLARGVVTTERDAQSEAIEPTVLAISRAMNDATREVADAVAVRLTR